MAESEAGRPADADADFEHALSLLAATPYSSQTLRFKILQSYADSLAAAGHKKEAGTIRKQASKVAKAIGQQSYAEDVVDVASFR